MDILSKQLARLKQSPIDRLREMQEKVTANDVPDEPHSEPSKRELRQIRRDPDIQAQNNVAIATTINPSSADERELEVYYKVNDPMHFFICKADDLDRRPGQNDGQYRAYQQKMARMWTDRFIKTHPEHGKGRIDRLSTHRKRKPRRVKVASKSKGKRYTASERRRILRMADKRGISKAAEHYGVSSTTIHNWKASGVKTKSNGRIKVSTNRGSLSVIRDLAQKLLIAIDEHRAGVDGLYS